MKKLFCLLFALTLVLSGCTKELAVSVSEELTVEYGEELDNALLFNAEKSDDGVTVKSVEGYDPNTTGAQTLTVTYTDGEREFVSEVVVNVEDTKAPTIKLNEETLTITEGDEISLTDNIASVSDEIDGDLSYSEEAISSNAYYLDLGEFDNSIPGTYEIKVIAIDKNSNKAEASFNVTVAEKPVQQTARPNTQSSSSSSSNNGISWEDSVYNNSMNAAGSNDVGDNPGQTIANTALSLVGTQEGCTLLVEKSVNAIGKTGWLSKTEYNADGVLETVTYLTPENYTVVGSWVSTDSMQPGDVIYYADGGLGVSHVAIYVGNGQAVHGGYNQKYVVLMSASVGGGITGVYRMY